MRTATPALLLAALLSVGCGANKSSPAPPPAPVVETPAPVVEAPAPVVEAPPSHAAERPPEPAPSNIDATVAIAFADGTVTKGHLVRVERSEDWHAEKGWTDRDLKLTVTLEDGDTEIEAQWTELSSIDIAYGDKSDVNCSFDSSYTPAMYECVLGTTPMAKLTDGRAKKVIARHKWRFTFASGDVEEFWLYKLPHRRQEVEIPQLGDTSMNTTLEMALRNELIAQRSGRVPKRITIRVNQ